MTISMTNGTSSVRVASTWSLLTTSTDSSVSMSPARIVAGAVTLDAQHLGRVEVVLHHQRLDVEHDVGDVLQDARDRGELVLGVVDLDLGDRAALEAREQHAAEAVAHRGAEAALERLRHELAVGRREGLLLAGDHARQFESTPTDMHRGSPSERLSAVGRRLFG